MLSCQKHLFNIEEEVSYLNGAYMSPLLNEQERLGQQALQKLTRPYRLSAADFFEPVQQIKQLFSQLINANAPERICMIPSVSYGIASVCNNIKLKAGQEVVMVKDQFPSNYYSWERIAQEAGAALRMVSPEAGAARRGHSWNEQLLAAIGSKTAVVAIAQVHWADGTLYDLKAIREKTRQHQALLIIDGTQSIGALPFDQQEIQADAIICAAYKWLIGPYGIGMAYMGPYFDDGQPIEDSWINRLDSEDFSQLVNYQPAYQPGAGRYSVGENSRFLHIPMLHAGLEQLLKWTSPGIQAYCQQLTTGAIALLREEGAWVEEEAYRGHHLFGIHMPEGLDVLALHKQLQKEQIYVSRRGNALRISPNVYNKSEDIERLVGCFRAAQRNTRIAT